MSKVHSTPPIAIENGRNLIEHAREQLNICRADILIGVRGLNPQHLSPECANMAKAIVEYFSALAAVEAIEADPVNDSTCACTYSKLN